MGLVAQRIRARGYEPRCRGFESLLAHNLPKREGPFPPVPPGGRKIMFGIAIADSKLMFARGNFELSGESMTASKMHLLVNIKIMNWLVVNSPRTME